MKFVSAILFAAAVANAVIKGYTNDHDGFTQWMVDTNQKYGTEEVFDRFNIWSANHKFVENHNAQADKGAHSFRLGMTSLAGMTNDEYRAKMLKYRASSGERSFPASGTHNSADYAAPPASQDWRTHTPAVVSPIKDQGQCGSCWAFSAVEAMEAVAALKTGKLAHGAPQQCVDCVNGGADTCDLGGEMHDCYLSVMKSGGLDTELSYPYEAQSGGGCRFKPHSVIAGTTSFSGYKNVTQGNETDLMSAAAAIPTVSIGIDASSMAFQLYSSGIYNPLFCKNKMDQLDHGVAIVGYGSEDGKNYWLVRNSWGTIWGMEGYVKMIKDDKNKCGVATDATYPIYS
jgi:cathepsin L